MSSKGASRVFFCHACGRHTSRSFPAKQVDNPTPPKYCSDRCRSEGRPSAVIAIAWKNVLDSRKTLHGIPAAPAVETSSIGIDLHGRRKPLFALCEHTQTSLFSSDTGRITLQLDPSQPQSAVGSTELDSQQLGMAVAHNRESVRRAARLLVHFGFPHFNATQCRPKSRLLGSTIEAECMRAAAGELRAVEAIGADGKPISDVTHAKGDWGLRWKQHP